MHFGGRSNRCYPNTRSRRAAAVRGPIVRQVMDGIFYVLRTGCQWKALPREYGSGSTVHRYFQEWTEQGVFGKAWRRMLKRYDRRRGIGWNWQSVDGSMTKAPLGGEKNRQKPHRSR